MYKVIKIALVVVIFVIGLFMKSRRPDMKTMNNKSKKFFKGENAALATNYLGNLLVFETFAIITYFLSGYQYLMPYLVGSVASMAAIICHIKDVTGKSIETVFNSIKFTPENLRMNIFMRTSFILSIILLIMGFVVRIIFKS